VVPDRKEVDSDSRSSESAVSTSSRNAASGDGAGGAGAAAGSDVSAHSRALRRCAGSLIRRAAAT
jgi:hypothetical protein